MSAQQVQPPNITDTPEWRRSGPFLLLALALHLVTLATPQWWARPESPPQPLSVTLIKPPEPLPIAAARPAISHPATPTPHTPPAPSRERLQALATPVLAITPEQQPVASAPTIVAPAPVAAPDTTAKPTSNRGSNAGNGGPATTAANFDAAYLQNPKPSYPAISRRFGEEGKVLLRVRVSSEGKPLAVDLEKSSNFERLDNAARQVVLNWRFVPARRGDETIEATVTVPIIFRLDS